MGDGSLQATKYECDRKMYESAFSCDAEVHGMVGFFIFNSGEAWEGYTLATGTSTSIDVWIAAVRLYPKQAKPLYITI